MKVLCNRVSWSSWTVQQEGIGSTSKVILRFSIEYIESVWPVTVCRTRQYTSAMRWAIQSSHPLNSLQAKQWVQIIVTEDTIYLISYYISKPEKHSTNSGSLF